MLQEYSPQSDSVGFACQRAVVVADEVICIKLDVCSSEENTDNLVNVYIVLFCV